jgi:multiple sugar transport system ATP-binding protein
MIAGVEDITGGEIWIGDRLVNDIAPGDRNIAMVFQNYALYPHMSVHRNISFGLRQRRMPKDEIERRVRRAADTLGITHLLERKPRTLSGGQRQRVAMGRAMVRNPDVFLFDEPLSSLDAQLRVQMRAEIKRLLQTMPTTTIYVTHDQIEAMTMADQIVVMNAGRIEQAGSPSELYHRPATQFVAGFIGSPAMNFIPARVVPEHDGLSIKLADGASLRVPGDRVPSYGRLANQEAILGIRPESITEARSTPGAAPVSGTIQIIEPLGREALVYFDLGGISVCGRRESEVGLRVGDTMQMSIDMDQMHLIDKTTGAVLPPKAA